MRKQNVTDKRFHGNVAFPLLFHSEKVAARAAFSPESTDNVKKY